eukprot:m.635458 g.635458  ORF g.635458 m.635458 type:complete len:642 (+) comp22584_c0_seq1:370-2295(+)
MAQGDQFDDDVANETFDDELSFAATTFGDEGDSDESSSQQVSSEQGIPENDSGYSSSPRRTSDDDGHEAEGSNFIGSFQSDVSYSNEVSSFGKRSSNVSIPRSSRMDASGRTRSATATISQSCSTRDSSMHEMSPRIRSRTRSRSKNESKNRRETSLEKSTAVVVRNLLAAPGLHDLFKSQLLSVIDFHKIRDFFIERKTDFAFVQAATAESAIEIVEHCNGMKLGDSEAVLSAERCLRITPLQDPKEYMRFGAVSDTVMLKNLPFNIPQKELESAIVSVHNIPTPVEITPRKNSTGDFCGMVFVAFRTPEDATTACRRLHGAEILSRKVHAEFKRVQGESSTGKNTGRQRANTLSGDTVGRHSDARSQRHDLSQRDIELKLDAFVTGKDAHIDFPHAARRNVHHAVERFGLVYSCEQVWDKSTGNSGVRVIRVRKGTCKLSQTYSGDGASRGGRSTPSSLLDDHKDGSRNSYRDCHSCNGGSSYTSHMQAHGGGSSYTGDDQCGSFGRHHNSYSSGRSTVSEKHGFRPHGGASGSSGNSASSYGSRWHDRERSGSTSSKHGRGTPTYRMSQNSRPSTPSSTGSSASHHPAQKHLFSPCRQRAHTHSGATLPGFTLENGVVSNAIIRTPKGPDGTRGFHER